MEKDSIRRLELDRVVTAVVQNWRKNWRTLMSRRTFTSPRTSFLRAPKMALQSYLMCIPEIAREITSCWISAVPSKMS